MKRRHLQLRFTQEEIVSFLTISLLFLIFISKISLKWLGIPENYSFLIFQHGLHPFINFTLNFLIGGVLFFIWIRKQERTKLSPYYVTFLFFLSAVLSIQTLFQITLVNVAFSATMQIGGLVMAIALIFIYGIIIPSLLPIDIFAKHLRNLSVFLVLISLILLPIFWPMFFRGGRFIGVFKHIPYMVNASTFAFVFFIPMVFGRRDNAADNNTFFLFILLFLIAVAVTLTATKAAVVTILIAFVMAMVLYPAKNKSVFLFKLLFISMAAFVIIMFGVPITKAIYEVATGQRAFGMRTAQDGIEARMDEVTRGLDMFHRSPYFGSGLLYKYIGEDGVMVDSYDPFKDPHNLFVSAGVIGGWPLIILSIIGYSMLMFGAIKGVLHKSDKKLLPGLFILSHLPVFVIYPAHFSLGGIADRIYWLVFGYLAVNYPQNGNNRSLRVPSG